MNQIHWRDDLSALIQQSVSSSKVHILTVISDFCIHGYASLDHYTSIVANQCADPSEIGTRLALRKHYCNRI
jgi:hypothetical protein